MLEMPSFPNRSEARQSPRQWPSGALSVSKTCWMCAEWMWWSLTVVILFGLDRVPIHLHAGILCFGEDFQTLNSKHSPFLGRNHVKCGQSSLIIIFGAMFRQTKHNTTQHIINIFISSPLDFLCILVQAPSRNSSRQSIGRMSLLSGLQLIAWYVLRRCSPPSTSFVLFFHDPWSNPGRWLAGTPLCNSIVQSA